MSDREKEFNDFIEGYKRIEEGSADKNLDEMNTNYQKYKIRETNTSRNEIEYFTDATFGNNPGEENDEHMNLIITALQASKGFLSSKFMIVT